MQVFYFFVSSSFHSLSSSHSREVDVGGEFNSPEFGQVGDVFWALAFGFVEQEQIVHKESGQVGSGAAVGY